MDIKRLKEDIKEIKDPRRSYGNKRHKLEDIIVIGLLSIISMGEDFVDMEIFGKKREQWLRRFLELPHGIPDSDTFRRVFERLDPQKLSGVLTQWLETEQNKGNIRGCLKSFEKNGNKRQNNHLKGVV